MNNNLTQEEYDNVVSSCGGNVLAAAVARMYTCSPNTSSWSYSHKWGVLAFVANGASHSFRLLDFNNFSNTLWDFELYNNFEYESPKPFFHTFEGPDAIIGLSFADESDAKTVYSAVHSIPSSGISSNHSEPEPNHEESHQFAPANPSSRGPTPRGPPSGAPSRPAPPTRPAPSGSFTGESAGGAPSHSAAPPSLPPHSAPSHSAPPPIPSHAAAPTHSAAPPSHSSAPSHPPALNRASSTTSLNVSTPASAPAPTPQPPAAVTSGKGKTKGSGFGFGKKLLSKIGLGEEESSPADSFEISKPRDFRHESHIGWDPANGFEIRNIPPQWRKLFQAAGVKKSELQNPETAKFIMETVATATVGNNPMAGGPPPPASGGGGPPPPAPSGPPPPAAPTGPPPPAGGPPSGPPTGGGGGGGIFAGLGTVQLKKAEERAVPDIEKLDGDQKGALADTLAKAMEQRRDAFNVDSDDFASEEEWSD